MRTLICLATLCTTLAFQTPSPEAYVPQVWEKPIAPGLVYREIVDRNAHRTIHALRFSMGSPAIKLETDLFGQRTYKRSPAESRGPLSRMVSDQGAIAGVNGDFFSMSSGYTGDPLGTTVREGRLLSTPSKRIAFGWGPDTVSMGFASFSGTVQSGDRVLRIDGVNRKCPDDSITLDTPDSGFAVGAAPSLMAVVRFDDPTWSPSTVMKGTVESLTEGGDPVAVEAGHGVFVARGAKREMISTLQPGTEVTVVLKTTGFDWANVDNVIGGGPILVRNGAVAVDAKEEGFPPEFSDRKHPRTAIGTTKAGDVWLVAVDGRQETGDGMTLAEMAQTMLDLGCTDAMNLDGGGSTTMNVRGVTVNRPSDGIERAIADGVLVMGPRPQAGGTVERLILPKEMEAGSRAVAWVQRGASREPVIATIWGCQGACAIDQGGTLLALTPGTAKVTAWAEGQLLSGTVSVVARRTR